MKTTIEILIAARERGENGLALEEVLAFDELTTLETMTLMDVEQLERLNLITVQPSGALRSLKQYLPIATHREIKITLTPFFFDLQKALGFSLRELANYDPSTIRVKPLFGAPKRQQIFDIFVVMPFAKTFDPIMNSAVRPAAEKLGLSVGRGDDFSNSNAVVSDIWDAIFGARFVIVDCTGQNANVMYELGIVHSVGKQAILICQKKEDIPYDLRHMRYHLYENDPEKLHILKGKLIQFLRGAI